MDAKYGRHWFMKISESYEHRKMHIYLLQWVTCKGFMEPLEGRKSRGPNSFFILLRQAAKETLAHRPHHIRQDGRVHGGTD